MDDELVWVECRSCGATGEDCAVCDGASGRYVPLSEAPDPDEHGERWA